MRRRARVRLKLLAVGAAVVLVAAAGFEHLRLARLVARSVTNADVALMWFTARDLGASGYDSSFGWGLVQAEDALGELRGE